jgi:acetyltransferase
VIDDAGVDAVCVNFATVAGEAAQAGAVALREIVCATEKPLVAFVSTPRAQAEAALATLAAGGIPVFPSPERAAKAIAALAAWPVRRREAVRWDEDDGRRACASTPAIARRMSEAASKAVLERIGVPVTRDLLVQNADDAKLVRLRVPLAIKISSPDIAHKTDIGALRLNVKGRAELRTAIREVLAAAHAHAPEAVIEGVIVSEMVTGGVELLVGAVNDAVFGPVVVVGAGGIHAEVLGDRTCRIAPFGQEVAMDMLGELRCSPILRGARGSPSVDVQAVAGVLVRLSRYVWENRDAVAEIDINPLIATPQGAIAADALIVGRCAD